MRRCVRLTCLIAGLLATGCARRPDPGLAAVPSLPIYRAGVYADINPRWSHDGSRIAFLRATPDRKHQLYVVDDELDRPLALLESELVTPDRPYSPGLDRYCSPDTLAWSPDDSKIAFERIEWFTFDDGERLPGTGLWAFDTYSGRVSPLALHPSHYQFAYYYYHTPAWSPDGRYLAFVGEGISGQRALYVHPLLGQKAQSVTPQFDHSTNSDWPAWIPLEASGKPNLKRQMSSQLVYRQGKLRAPLAPPTETLRLLTPGSASETSCKRLLRVTSSGFASFSGEPPVPGENVSPRVGHLTWSPDGSRLAFTLTPDANDFTRYQLWVMRRDGTEATRVSPRDHRGYFAPVWIGNDRMGALSPRSDQFEVVTIDLNSHAARRLGLIDSADCDWSPDRARIVYAEPRSDTPPNKDNPTTLRLFETGLRPGTAR